MATKALPSPEVLRQLLRYEPDTGKLFWLPRPVAMFSSHRSFKTWNARFSGAEAFFTLTNHGYFIGTILNVRLLSHRVIWTLQTGQPPIDQIDHINGIRTDNRWTNLRAASGTENARNKGAASSSTSKFRGVSWLRRERFWRSRLQAGGVEYTLGLFRDEEAAARAYDAKATEIYGEFARLNFASQNPTHS